MQGQKTTQVACRQETGSDLPWRDWLRRFFPHVATKPFAPRMERLWEWFDSLTPGEVPSARVEVWPRGGGKSASSELGCARVGTKLSRRFVLYVSGTQPQADLHVQAIGALFEHLGAERSVNRYGSSKGWRRDQLRTESGFNVAAYGLDVAARGVRLDNYRPDLIILDDIDSRLDTQATTAKKITTITQSLLPAGSTDCAVLFLQNLVHRGGIVSQLVRGEADFLHDREVPMVEPAVIDLQFAQEEQLDGTIRYRITAGTPTWAGQDLAICEKQLNTWGPIAFLREAQQEVGESGDFFREEWLPVVDEVPTDLRKVRAWDKAATEGGGDFTAGVLWGAIGDERYILDVVRGQWGPEHRNRRMRETAAKDGAGVQIWIEEEGGSAGKDASLSDVANLRGFRVQTEHPTGDKEVRAEPFRDAAAEGRVKLLRGPWNRAFILECCSFPGGGNDDQVDAASLGLNKLARNRELEFYSLSD